MFVTLADRVRFASHHSGMESFFLGINKDLIRSSVFIHLKSI